MIYHLTRDELADQPVGAAITVRGKELRPGDTVAHARGLLAGGGVFVVPVLDRGRYVGALDRDMLAGLADDQPVGLLAADIVPVARADCTTAVALQLLDEQGGQRLVVVDEGGNYVGLVCLRGDRRRLCVDARRVESLGGE